MRNIFKGTNSKYSPYVLILRKLKWRNRWTVYGTTEPEVSSFLGSDLGGDSVSLFLPKRAWRTCNFPPTRQGALQWPAVTLSFLWRLVPPGLCRGLFSTNRVTTNNTATSHPPWGTPCPWLRAQITVHLLSAHAQLSTGRWEPGPQATPSSSAWAPQAAHCNSRLFAWELGLKTTNRKMIARMQFGERKKLVAIFRLFSRYVCLLCGKRTKILHGDVRGLMLSLSSGKIPVTLIFAVNSEFKDRAPKQREINWFNDPVLGKLLTTFTQKAQTWFQRWSS